MPRFPRERLGLLFTLALIVTAIVVAFFTVGRNLERSSVFSEPKVLKFYVGGVTVPLQPKGPIAVLPDAPVEIFCEVVPPTDEQGTAVYRFQGPDGAKVDSPRCSHFVTFPGALGTELPVGLEYVLRRPDGSEQVIDSRRGTVRLTEVKELVKLYRFATTDGTIVETAMVPGEVIPHPLARVRLPGPLKDYVFLFFVRRHPDGAPVLQVVVPPDDPEDYRALALPLREYRSYGGGLTEYVAWPEEPDELVRIGNPEDQRQIFEVFTGVFPRAEVDRLLKLALTLERAADDRVVFTAGSLTLEDVRAAAVQQLLSEPAQVVRGDEAPSSSVVEMTVRPAPAPIPVP